MSSKINSRRGVRSKKYGIFSVVMGKLMHVYLKCHIQCIHVTEARLWLTLPIPYIDVIHLVVTSNIPAVDLSNMLFHHNCRGTFVVGACKYLVHTLCFIVRLYSYAFGAVNGIIISQLYSTDHMQRNKFPHVERDLPMCDK